MSWVRQYLLSVTAAAIICAIIKVITENKKSSYSVIKLLTGIFITITVVAPWRSLDFSDISSYIKNFSLEADTAVATGIEYAQEESAALIKEQVEAYILDKARTLGLELQVSVTMNADSPPMPCSVSIQGNAAPYAKERLTQYLTEEMGIPEACQTWN